METKLHFASQCALIPLQQSSANTLIFSLSTRSDETLTSPFMTYDYYSGARRARYITHRLAQACKKHTCTHAGVHAVGPSSVPVALFPRNTKEPPARASGNHYSGDQLRVFTFTQVRACVSGQPCVCVCVGLHTCVWVCMRLCHLVDTDLGLFGPVGFAAKLETRVDLAKTANTAWSRSEETVTNMHAAYLWQWRWRSLSSFLLRAPSFLLCYGAATVHPLLFLLPLFFTLASLLLPQEKKLSYHLLCIYCRGGNNVNKTCLSHKVLNKSRKLQVIIYPKFPH